MCDLANSFNSITTVAFYDTLGPEAVNFVLKQTELTSVCCAGPYVSKLIDLKNQGKSYNLQNIISFEPLKDDEKKQAEEAGLNLLNLWDVVESGRAVGTATFNYPEPESIYMFCYTSGTTGDPKAVMLTHQNLISSASGCSVHGIQLQSTDIIISYLPLAHSFEKMVFFKCMLDGVAVGYYSGDPLKLLDDLKALRPTIFPSVPRLFNRIFDRIQDNVSKKSAVKQWMFNRALNSKLSYLESQAAYTHKMWDSLVFGQIQELVGGRVRLMMTGSAPISENVLNFLKVAFACPIIEGYGQTETSAAVSACALDDPRAGHVGPPIPSVMIRLRDIPEMGYYHTDENPRGEVCFKGPSVFSGYFKAPDKNEEAFDKDGWLLSGDVGMVYPNGTLKIIDRAKNIFKLSQGEYIAPEKLENVYIQSPLIAQIFVYGDSLQSYLVSIVVPDVPSLKEWAKNNLQTEEPESALIEKAEVKKAVLDEMNRLATENKFSGLERIKKVYITLEPFTIENDILTPTMKIKRNIAKKMFIDQISAMYAEGL